MYLTCGQVSLKMARSTILFLKPQLFLSKRLRIISLKISQIKVIFRRFLYQKSEQPPVCGVIFVYSELFGGGGGLIRLPGRPIGVHREELDSRSESVLSSIGRMGIINVTHTLNEKNGEQKLTFGQ